jgi:SsrA-binding protein
LHKRELKKLLGKIKTKGYTLVPLSLYFNERNKVKVELALAKGKQLFDKRAAIKNREWTIEKSRILREK